MIFDTSYTDKETTKQIDTKVGAPFSWTQRWKMRGIGSDRMVISEISEKYKKYTYPSHYQSLANIELRPKGIIIHFRHKLQAYAWVMPYSDLKIEYKQSLRITSLDGFIQFDQPKNESFIRKMLAEYTRINQTT